MAQRKHEPGPPMDLANMRRQGVQHLIAYCHNCRHQAVIDVSNYPDDVEVPWFQSKVKCSKCGRGGRRVDVRPNWKEAPGMPDNWQGRDAWKRDVHRALPANDQPDGANRAAVGLRDQAHAFAYSSAAVTTSASSWPQLGLG